MQIGSAEQYAQAGDVILSPEVAGVTVGHCTVTPLEGNNARLVSMSKSAIVSGTFPDPAMCSLCCQVLHVHNWLRRAPCRAAFMPGYSRRWALSWCFNAHLCLVV